MDKKIMTELIEICRKRRINFYHTCQFKDLLSYCEEGGIVTKKFLSNHSKPFSSFLQENIEKEELAFSSLVLHPDDFGRIFARGAIGIPNVAGPITLRMPPSTLLKIKSFELCMTEIDFKKRKLRNVFLNGIEDFKKLFKYNDEHVHCNWFKSLEDLGMEINKVPKRSWPTFYCEFEEDKIPITDVEYIIVDPYKIEGISLIEAVKDIIRGVPYRFAVRIRARRGDRFSQYQEIMEAICNGATNFEELVSLNQSKKLHFWLEHLREQDLKDEVTLYVESLRRGTLAPILGK